MWSRTVAGGNAPPIPGTAPSFGPAPAITSGPAFPSMTGSVKSGQFRDLRGGYASGGMSMSWYGLPVVGALAERLQSDLRQAADEALSKLQEDMVAYAKQNAPWQDITGDARAELHSPPITTSHNGDRSIILAHGVDYGIYLETHNGGQFAIIVPTIKEFAGRLSDYMRSAT